MPKNNDDLSNEILALLDDKAKDDSSDGGRPRRRVSNVPASDSNLSASSSDYLVDSEDEGRAHNHRIGQDSSSSEDEELNLEHLTEIEREQIIAEKAEKNQKKYERQEILSRLSKQKKNVSKSSRNVVCDSDEGSDEEFIPSSRPHRNKTSHSQALKELKDRRNKKKNRALSKGSDDSSQDEAHYTPQRSQTPPEEVDNSPPVVRLEQLEKIILTRQDLAAMVHDRMLEKMAVGCFVSVAREPKPDGTQVYRLGKITAITESKQSYVVERTRTHRMLELSHGADVLEFAFDVVEFERYLESCEKSGLPPITLNYVKRKEEELFTLKERARTNDDFEYTMRSNRISSNNPKVHLSFKKYLLGQIQIAKDNDEVEKAAALEEELTEVEKGLAPLLDKYEIELQSNLVMEEERKDNYRKFVVSAAQATKKDIDNELKRKRWVDSDDAAGKDTCFNLKVPKLPPKGPYTFPAFNPPASKSFSDATPLTLWEQIAIETMSTLI
ncbi:RNA polymerase-associated protein rtf1 [Massospora cicadina]|nr:RNA polymerase-associated protein rtf1 [Massospora cicadina]